MRILVLLVLLYSKIIIMYSEQSYVDTYEIDVFCAARHDHFSVTYVVNTMIISN